MRPSGFTNHRGDSSYHRLRALFPPLQPHHTVVDIGCGTGDFLASLPTGPRLIGIDPDHNALHDAAATTVFTHKIHWRLGSFANTGLPAQSADIVCSHSALMLAADIHAACAEIGRILRPGGLVAMVLPWRVDDAVHPLHGHYFGAMLAVGSRLRTQGFAMPMATSNFACGEPQFLKPYFSQAAGFANFTATRWHIDFSGTPAQILETIAQMSFMTELPPIAQALALRAARTYLDTHAGNHTTILPFRRPFWSFQATRTPTRPTDDASDIEISVTV